MNWKKYVQYRRGPITVQFTPLENDRQYSHAVAVVRGNAPIGKDFLQKGQAITERTAEAFYQKYAAQSSREE